MVESVNVIGRGRVGSALAARLEERGVALREDAAELVLLCVPDTAIRDIAHRLTPGPWVAHVSGATALAALDPHDNSLVLLVGDDHALKYALRHILFPKPCWPWPSRPG